MFQPGDYFPTPAQIAEFSGASLEEGLQTVATLLESGRIRQTSKGLLVVCAPKRERPARRPVTIPRTNTFALRHLTTAGSA
jgi:hypothetical protein